MRVAAEWDPQFTRMMLVSAALHVTALFALLVVLPMIHPGSAPMTAYVVELTDARSLGGRLAPGRPDQPLGPRPGTAPAAETPAPAAPAAKADAAPPPEPPKPVEPPKAVEPPKPIEPPKPVEAPKPVETAKAAEPPKAEPPAVQLPSIEKPPPPKPEPKKVEPKPEPTPEAKKPEPAPPKPAAKAEAAKPPEPTPPATAAAKAPEAKPAAEAKPATKPDGKPGAADASDGYAAAAQKWRAKGATGGGGGLGGTDTSAGPIGTPGYGGGGEVVGFEFLAYQQRVVATVKAVWTNAVTRPGLVAKVRFQIAPNGDVSGIRLEQASGDGVFDGSVVRAVERATPLPPPPARYMNEFRDFVIEFHSEEEGGRAAG